jgi:hypothetical protein
LKSTPYRQRLRVSAFGSTPRVSTFESAPSRGVSTFGSTPLGQLRGSTFGESLWGQHLSVGTFGSTLESAPSGQPLCAVDLADFSAEFATHLGGDWIRCQACLSTHFGANLWARKKHMAMCLLCGALQARIAGCSNSIVEGDDHHWVEFYDPSQPGPFGDFWHTKEGVSEGNEGGPWDSVSGPMRGCLRGVLPHSPMNTIWAANWSAQTFLPTQWNRGTFQSKWSYVLPHVCLNEQDFRLRRLV